MVDRPKGGGYKYIPVPILDEFSTIEFEKRLLNHQAISLKNIIDVEEVEDKFSVLCNNGFLYGEFQDNDKKSSSCIFKPDGDIKRVALNSITNINNYSTTLGKRLIFIEESFLAKSKKSRFIWQGINSTYYEF